MKNTFIYALCDGNKKVMYIGRAHNPRKRLSTHISKASNEKTPKALWIQSLISSGLKPCLEVLDEVPMEEWKFWEREYISFYKTLGLTLLNSNNGGSGPTEHSDETKSKIGATHRGISKSKEQREKTSAALIGHLTSVATRQKISSTLTGKKHSQETKAKMSASRLRYLLAKD